MPSTCTFVTLYIRETADSPRLLCALSGIFPALQPLVGTALTYPPLKKLELHDGLLEFTLTNAEMFAPDPDDLPDIPEGHSHRVTINTLMRGNSRFIEIRLPTTSPKISRGRFAVKGVLFPIVKQIFGDDLIRVTHISAQENERIDDNPIQCLYEAKAEWRQLVR